MNDNLIIILNILAIAGYVMATMLVSSLIHLATRRRMRKPDRARIETSPPKRAALVPLMPNYAVCGKLSTRVCWRVPSGGYVFAVFMAGDRRQLLELFDEIFPPGEPREVIADPSAGPSVFHIQP